MTLGKMIRSIREGVGYTQAEIASALSISDAYICQLENGKRTAELRYKDDIYWGLAKIASRGIAKPCWDIYITLIGLDMEWRDPMIYEALGRHFYQRFRQEEGQNDQRSSNRLKARRKKARALRRASNY
jgi:transcriptional regulator with XRE-family HTH domain